MPVTFNLSNRKGLTININKKSTIQNLKSVAVGFGRSVFVRFSWARGERLVGGLAGEVCPVNF